MQAAWYQAQQFVAAPVHEELQRDCARGILLILIEQALAHAERVEERAYMDTPLLIQEVEFAGRRVGVLAILRHRIIRCKEARASNHAMKGYEHGEPFGKLAAFDHFASGSVRILGSAQ